MPWDRVHEEAEKWEHTLSEYLEDRIDALLGHPEADPHGALIPRRDGAIPERMDRQLWELEPGQAAIVVEVSDHDPVLLRYVGGLGLYPGTMLTVMAKGPFDGPLTIRVDEKEYALGREVARHIWVTDSEDS